MAENKLDKKDQEIAELKQSLTEKDKEIAALKVTAPEASAKKVLLSDKDRTFTVKGDDNEYRLKDVNKIYIDGIRYTAQQFLADTKLQKVAVESSHLLIEKIVK